MEKHRKRSKGRLVRLSQTDEEFLTRWLELSGLTFQTLGELAILSYLAKNPNPEYLREQNE